MKYYGTFHLLMQWIAVTPPGSWYFSKTQHFLDILFFRTVSRKHTATKVMAGLRIVMMTTRGAKSGVQRMAPLVYVRIEDEADEFAVVASNWGQIPFAAWYFNLKADPRAECDIGGVTRHYRGHEAVGEEYERYRAAALTTYIGFPKYYERLADHRPIPIFVMRPAD